MDILENQPITDEQTPSSEEATLLKYIAGLTKSDIDRLLSISKNETKEKSHSQPISDYLGVLASVYRNSNLNTTGNSPQTRNQRYEVYDEMDESTAYISSALDILSDDATQTDEDNVIIHVSSESSKVVTIVNKFIEEFELEDKIAKWARAVAKYGDLFIKVEGEQSRGVSYINDTIYPGVIDRRDLNGKLVAFTINQSSTYSAENIYAPWEFVHFRHKGDIYKAESNYNRLGTYNESFDENLTSAYGQSILRPAIKVYAQLRFVENMLLLSRLTNSIRRNIFLINTGEVAPDKAFDTIQNYANLLKKDVNLNLEDGIYSSARHTINYDEDIFLPVGDPQNDVRIEQVGGDANMKEQYDLEYLLNKLFSALKIPKAYLNYEQDLNARSTLIQLDIRYARSVSQLQTTMTSGIKRLINIHLAYLGLDPDEIDLQVALTSVSAIDEEARVEQQSKQIEAARNMWDLLTSMKDSMSAEGTEPLDLQAASECLMKDYLELDQQIIDKIFNKPEDDSITPINSSKSYSYHRRSSTGTDLHAAYPLKNNISDYNRIRESIINDMNKSNTETSSKESD